MEYDDQHEESNEQLVTLTMGSAQALLAELQSHPGFAVSDIPPDSHAALVEALTRSSWGIIKSYILGHADGLIEGWPHGD